MPRSLRAALAAALLVTALAPLATTAQVPVTKCAGEAGRTRRDGWLALPKPAWSFGDQVLTGWAVSRFVDGYVLATNGTVIARSLDGGCLWEEVYSPSAIGAGEIGLRIEIGGIHGIALPPSPPGGLGYTAWAVLGDGSGSAVVTSGDLGRTWVRQPSIGLPPLTAFHSIHVAADPRVAYVLGDVERAGISSLVETMLYVTRDGGITFTPVTRGVSPMQFSRIKIDPIDPRHVWAWDDTGLYRSVDHGATFTRMAPAGPFSAVDVWHFPAFAPARVVAYRSREATASLSADGGATWKTVPTHGRVTGAANLYTSEVTATTSSRGVVVDGPNGLVDVSPRGVVLDELAWSGYAGVNNLTLYGSSEDELFLRRFTPAAEPKAPPPVVNLRGGAVIKRGPTALRPGDQIVRLRPGERRTLTYRLDLSPVPTPLDVFFATDSTGSMNNVINGLRDNLQDIIDDLGGSGIDVWFGVGDFRDYPTFGQPTDHPYRRMREVGPIDEELERALERIDTGGGRGLNSMLAAVYQAASGEGQQRVAVAGGEAGGHWIEPGLGAEWRANSLKVLVIASDVRSRDPETDTGYPGPSYGKVIGKLNSLRVKHVGLAVGDAPDAAYQSLAQVSAGTQTIAPAGGTDCDDDGRVDIRAGEPLVCELSGRRGTNLTPAMVGLLSSLEDLQTVSLRLTGDRRVARVTGLADVPDVNVKGYNQLTYDVVAACDATTAGSTYRFGVQATAAGRVVAGTGLTVVCETLPVVPPNRPEEFPPPAVRTIVAVAVPPPPPPPAPVPQPQPQTQPNPNPNPNPQVVTQVGMAAQDQAQVELALAHAEMQFEEEQLAMSGLGDDDAARAAGVLCAGMVLTAGAAVGLRHRTRTAAAQARVRSSG